MKGCPTDDECRILLDALDELKVHIVDAVDCGEYPIDKVEPLCGTILDTLVKIDKRARANSLLKSLFGEEG